MMTDPKTWVGIDPGLEGAVAVLDGEGNLACLWDIPIEYVKRKRRQKQVHLELLDRIIAALPRYDRPAVHLEWPTTRPDEAAEASKNFGVGLGQLEALCMARGLEVVKLPPQKWKQDLGLPGKKHPHYTPTEARKAACNFACRMIPNLERSTVYGPRGGAKDGRAEALLMAWWGWSRTAEGMRILRERWGSMAESTEAMEFCLRAGSGRAYRSRKKKGPVL